MPNDVGTLPPLTEGSSSSSLVSRLRAHDGEAWQRLSDMYGPVVYGWARRAGLQDSSAADVTQDVFQAVAQRIADFRRDRPGDSFRGWLWGIAQHKLADNFRRQIHQPDAAGGSVWQDRLAQLADVPPDEDQAAEETGRLARRALALIRTDFQAATWQAFERTVIDGQAAADVAAELGLSIGAVYTAKCRVLARLRQELADPLE